ncbi:hypothetical protein YC2023_040059 [Brassica napus]
MDRKQYPISLLGVHEKCDLVSHSSWIELEPCWRRKYFPLPPSKLFILHINPSPHVSLTSITFF